VSEIDEVFKFFFAKKSADKIVPVLMCRLCRKASYVIRAARSKAQKGSRADVIRVPRAVHS